MSSRLHRSAGILFLLSSCYTMANQEPLNGRCTCRSVTRKVANLFDPFSGLDFDADIEIDNDLDEALFPAMRQHESGNRFLEFGSRPTSCVHVAAAQVSNAPEVASPEAFIDEVDDVERREFIEKHSAVVSWRCRKHREDDVDCVQVWLRPLTGSDSLAMSEGVSALSDRSKFLRFLRPIKEMSQAQTSRCCELGDYNSHFAFGLSVKTSGGAWLGIGAGSFVKDRHDSTHAEVAITINDGWQGLGLASLLGFVLAKAAFARGIEALTAIHHSGNVPMAKHVKTLASSGVGVSSGAGLDRSVTELTINLPIEISSDALPLSAEDFLRAAAAGAGETSL